MTAPYQRSSVEGVLGNHEKRIGNLEAYGLEPVTFSIKLAGDDPGVDVPAYIVNGRFYVGIPMELDGWYVVKFWGYQSDPTGASIDTKLRLSRKPSANNGTGGGSNAVTSTNVTIPFNAIYPSVQAVIDDTKNIVVGEKHMLRVDVLDLEPNKVWGLSCEITLSPKNVLL